MTLTENARAVRTREDLVTFLKSLSEDFVTNQTNWTNIDLASFLDAMSGWSQDMEGFYENGGEVLDSIPPWRVLAEILVSARIYE